MRHQYSGISKLLALWRKSYYQRAREMNKGVVNKYACDWAHKNEDLSMDVKDRLGIPASQVSHRNRTYCPVLGLTGI